jgi:hypothetical protein
MGSIFDPPFELPPPSPDICSGREKQQRDLESDKHFPKRDVLLLTQAFIRFIVKQ